MKSRKPEIVDGRKILGSETTMIGDSYIKMEDSIAYERAFHELLVTMSCLLQWSSIKDEGQNLTGF